MSTNGFQAALHETAVGRTKASDPASGKLEVDQETVVSSANVLNLKERFCPALTTSEVSGS